jgi:hypothetical protein
VFGGTAAGVAAGGLFAQSAAEAMEYTRRAEATEVGPRTLDHLELVIAGMAAAFAYTPPSEMFPQARWYRRHVAQLIEGRRYTLRVRRPTTAPPRCGLPVNSPAPMPVWGQPDDFREALRDTQHRLNGLSKLGCGLFSADAGRIASYAATSSIWLGQPTEAMSYAEEALAFYQQVDPQQRSPTREAISRLDLGLALVDLKAPDGATDEAARALDSERVTGSVLTRAGELNAALQQRYLDYWGTAEFRERYRALTDQVGRPQLTSG